LQSHLLNYSFYKISLIHHLHFISNVNCISILPILFLLYHKILSPLISFVTLSLGLLITLSKTSLLFPSININPLLLNSSFISTTHSTIPNASPSIQTPSFLPITPLTFFSIPIYLSIHLLILLPNSHLYLIPTIFYSIYSSPSYLTPLSSSISPPTFSSFSPLTLSKTYHFKKK
jgi:hypothetical protein